MRMLISLLLIDTASPSLLSIMRRVKLSVCSCGGTLFLPRLGCYLRDPISGSGNSAHFQNSEILTLIVRKQGKASETFCFHIFCQCMFSFKGQMRFGIVWKQGKD